MVKSPAIQNNVGYYFSWKKMSEQKNHITRFRVYVTENCNANCPSCFNANSRTNSEMSVEMFEKLCIYLNKNGIVHLKIMGGEPTVHPDFEEIVKIAQKYFVYVEIFSNGLNGRIKNLSLRPKDGVTLNFLFRKTITAETLYLDTGGERYMQVQVLNNSDEKEIADKIIELWNIDKQRIGITLTLDCTSNIYKDKDVLVQKLVYIQNRAKKIGLKIDYDHKIPTCFWHGTGIEFDGDGICSLDSAGVIGADMALRFCLNYPAEIVKIYKNGSFIPWEILINNIWLAYYNLRINSLEKICIDCKEFNRTCNGGCWIPKENIKREDIIRHSDFLFREKDMEEESEYVEIETKYVGFDKNTGGNIFEEERKTISEEEYMKKYGEHKKEFIEQKTKEMKNQFEASNNPLTGSKK